MPPGAPRAQLQALYLCLLHSERRFDEFRELLLRYPPSRTMEPESVAAAAVRAVLNMRVAAWLEADGSLDMEASDFSAMTAEEVSEWRSIVIEERLLAAAPMRRMVVN